MIWVLRMFAAGGALLNACFTPDCRRLGLASPPLIGGVVDGLRRTRSVTKVSREPPHPSSVPAFNKCAGTRLSNSYSCSCSVASWCSCFFFFLCVLSFFFLWSLSSSSRT